MEESELWLMKEVQDRHWNWLGRKKMIQTVIEKHIDLSHQLLIADAGSGFGGNIDLLLEYGDVMALEPFAAGLDFIREKWGEVVKALAWRCPEKVGLQFDLIVMSESLEHIPDDREAVVWVEEHLKDGGYLLITAPAFNALWTQMDDVVHHHRRYDKRSLFALVAERFEIIQFSYYNFFLLPLKLGFIAFDRVSRFLFPQKRKESYNQLPPFVINKFSEYTVYFEAWLVGLNFSFPVGASLVMLVRKKI